MFLAVADQNILAGTAAILSWQPINQNGEPADPGAVTAVVTRADGTTQTVAASPSVAADPYTVTLALTVAEVGADPDRLSVAWSGANTSATTIVDVVGGVSITRAEFVLLERKHAQVTEEAFLRARAEVDAFVLERCKRSFVPRFAVERIRLRRDSSYLCLSAPDLRSVAFATDEDGDTIDVTGIDPAEDGIAELPDSYWPHGLVTVGYVHGRGKPPADLVGAMARHIAIKLNEDRSSIPSRASSVDTPFGSTSFTPMAGYGRALVGVPEIDETYNRYTWKVPGVA